MDNKPLVSVIIPTYNRPKYLERCLSSVKKQTYENIEIVIVDDGSSTKKENIAVVNKFKDLNIKYIYQQNSGAPKARNIGFYHSKGNFISFLDDDDEWLSEKIEKQVTKLLSLNDEYGAIYSWSNGIDDQGNIIIKKRDVKKGNILLELLYENFIPLPTIIIRREVFDRLNGFDENFKSCQDWELFIRIAEHYKFDLIDEVLVNFYKHNEPSIGKSKNAIDGYYMFYKKFHDLYKDKGLEKLYYNKLFWISRKYYKIGDFDKAKKILNEVLLNKFDLKALLYKYFIDLKSKKVKK